MDLKCTSQSSPQSFYKPCSENFRLNIWTPIPIQLYENASVYGTGCLIYLSSHSKFSSVFKECHVSAFNWSSLPFYWLKMVKPGRLLVDEMRRASYELSKSCLVRSLYNNSGFEGFNLIGRDS